MRDVEDDIVMDSELVERLHALLADALRGARPAPFDSPVTVAEIYQDLVPYRSVRSALDLQMNADYEHTLLRLLAGEGQLARLEPSEARDELVAELQTPNPNVGLFRKFAACDVWVTARAAAAAPPVPVPEAAPAPLARPEPVAMDSAAPQPPAPGPAAEASSWDEPAADWVEPQPGDDWDELGTELLLEEEVAAPDTPLQATSEPTDTTADQRAGVMFETNPAQATLEATAAGACAFCHSAMPAGRKVRYCPHCGQDRAMRPCSSCREVLEPGWKFCIACGAQQG